jgi:hypothetical protein
MFKITPSRRTKPMLGPVKNAKKTRMYCGPTVVSSITGRDGLMVKRVIRQYTGKRTVTGTDYSDLRYAFYQLAGFDLQEVECFASYRITERITFRQWCKQRTPEQRSQVMILEAGHHWMAVHGNRMVCAINGTEPVLISGCQKARNKVRKVYLVTKHRKPPAHLTA